MLDASSLAQAPDAWRQPLFLSLMAAFAVAIWGLARRAERAPRARRAWAPPRPHAGALAASGEPGSAAIAAAIDKEQYLAAYHLLRLATLDGSSPWYTYHRGLVLQVQGAWQEALACYDAVLQAVPEHREAAYNLACLWQSLGRASEAAAAYERMLQRHPDDVDALFNLGQIYFSLRLYDKAHARWMAAFRLAPLSPDLRTNLRLLKALRRTQRAHPA